MAEAPIGHASLNELARCGSGYKKSFCQQAYQACEAAVGLRLG